MIFKHKMSVMCMQNSHQVNFQLHDEKYTKILQVQGYKMYHKLILISMKWVKKLKESRKTMKKCKVEVKRN